MQSFSFVLFLTLGLCSWTGAAQDQSLDYDQTQFPPLICDTDSGFCALPGSGPSETPPGEKAADQKIKIIYFTDPICSSCWGIESLLRKLKLEYGHLLHIEYRMGGLLPDWSYRSGGISQPSDVARHWDEASRHYDMPMDGDLWKENPLSSSYPPSIAFKAAQAQDPQKAILFLRAMREGLFLQKQNITEWGPVVEAAQAAGLDLQQLERDVKGEARLWFQEDLDLAQAMGVRGFPTLFFINSAGQQERIYGALPYGEWEKRIRRLAPQGKKGPTPRTRSPFLIFFPA